MSGIVCSDVINKLSMTREFVNDIDRDLPALLDILKDSSDRHNIPLILKGLFGPVLHELTQESVESKLLQSLLPVTHNIFSSSLATAISLLENAEDHDEEILLSLSEVLQVCVDVLGGYYELLDFVVDLQHVKAKDVPSLIRTLPHILLEAFGHCQGSENNYGSYFHTSSDVLGAIFRKTYKLSTVFYKALDECIVFDCASEVDLDLLINVLDTLCGIGEMVVGLDLKNMVEQWKGLTKVIDKYSCKIKQRFNVDRPIKFLVSNLTETIRTLSDEKNELNEKNKIAHLKLGSFVLKVIVKLCELYNGYLVGCQEEILHLILLLNRCSRLRVGTKGTAEIERFIVVGATPLLSHLLDDHQFFEAYKKTVEETDLLSTDETIGFFFTYLRLLKLLVQSNDSATNEKWSKISLVPGVIDLFERTHHKIDFTISIEDNDAYTTLISVCVGYMITFYSTRQFVAVEKKLFIHLLGPDLETSILASDILCLLCRFTNEEVCLKEAEFLFKVLNLNSSLGFVPTVRVAGLTAGRLYSLLSRTGQEVIEARFPVLIHPQVWRYVQISPPVQLPPIHALQQMQDLSSSQYIHMVESMAVCSQFLKSAGSNDNSCQIIINNVNQLLLGLRSCLNDSTRIPDWWYYSLYILSKCVTRLLCFIDETSLEQIIDIFTEFCKYEDPSIHYNITALMEGLSHPQLPKQSQSVTRKVSNLFIKCLKSNDTLVKQISIERFAYFVQYSNFNDVSNNVMKQESINNSVNDYSLKKITVSTNNNFFGFKCDFRHKCFQMDYNIDSCQPNKRAKYTDNNEITETLEQFGKCIYNISKYIDQNMLSKEERDSVSFFINDIKVIDQKL